MRFVAGGPQIPDELLDARDAGKVVFFCGAGVSIPAGLPSFLELAKKVLADFGAASDSAVQRLLERISREPIYSPPLDQVFYLLQEEYGTEEVERSVCKALTVRSSSRIDQHSIVLNLSRGTTGKPQIVTTNFDRLFEVADRRINFFCPPFLPDLSMGAALEGLVYLHGRVPSRSRNENGTGGFVLSSSDFGRAYLAEGWATKFVRDLLRHYVIVLLGYSAADPPVRYLLEGLHTRASEERAEIYAFDRGLDDEVQSRWRGRGVKALSYGADHASLWTTLEAWCERAKDPEAWGASIVSMAADGPRGLLPHQRGQVAALVRSVQGAKAFAECERTPPAEWLGVFDRNIRLGTQKRAAIHQDAFDPLVAYGLDDDPPPLPDDDQREIQGGQDLLEAATSEVSRVRLSGHVTERVAFPPHLSFLVRWFARLADDPFFAWWAAGYPSLNRAVVQQLVRRFENVGDLSSLAVRVWSLLLEEFQHAPVVDDGAWFQWQAILKKEGWTPSVLRDFERIARPHLRSERALRLGLNDIPRSWKTLHFGQVVRFDVKFPLEHADEFDVESSILPKILKILMSCLEYASGYLCEIDAHYWRTPTFIPENGNGESYFDDKDKYILRFVGLFDRLISIDPISAKHQIMNWPKNDRFFFDKLFIYVVGKAGLFTGSEGASILADIPDEGFWNPFHRRELLHTLRARWRDLPASARRKIEMRLTEGPPRWQDEEEREYDRRRQVASATALGWLKKEGCSLSKITTRRLHVLRTVDPDWSPAWDDVADESHEGRGGWVSTQSDPSKIIDAPLSNLISLAEANTRSPFGEFTQYDPFSGLVQARPFRAIAALSYEARHGRFPVHFWRSAMSNWPDGTNIRLDMLLACRVAKLEAATASALKHEIGDWSLKSLPKIAQRSLRHALALWDAVVWPHLKCPSPSEREANVRPTAYGKKRSSRTYQQSINSFAGKLVATLCAILSKLRLSDNEGLPEEFSSRFNKLFNAEQPIVDYVVCELARRVSWLYFIDPRWTKANLIPRFNLSDVYAEPTWNGFLHDTRLPAPRLFALLKKDFLGVFSKSSEWDWESGPFERLADFLVIACFWNRNGGRYVSYAEARHVLQHFDARGRNQALWMLGNLVRDQKVWRSFGKPFIQRAWPREKRFQTPDCSYRFVRMAEELGDDFPDAVNTISPFLVQSAQVDLVLYRLKGKDGDNTSSPAKNFPVPTLVLLDRTISTAIPYPPHGLRPVLTILVERVPALRQDPRWRRLDKLAG